MQLASILNAESPSTALRRYGNADGGGGGGLSTHTIAEEPSFTSSHKSSTTTSRRRQSTASNTGSRADWRAGRSRRTSRVAEAMDAAAAKAAAERFRFDDWQWRPSESDLQRASTPVNPHRDTWVS